MADRSVLGSLDLFESPHTERFLKGDSIPETLEELKAVKKQLLEENYGKIEKAFLIKALKICNGNISHAAKKVGMQRSNFYTLMKKHHLSAKDIAKQEK
jgi:transcriptional regulator of acetoin/glycerol metabolism